MNNEIDETFCSIETELLALEKQLKNYMADGEYYSSRSSHETTLKMIKIMRSIIDLQQR